MAETASEVLSQLPEEVQPFLDEEAYSDGLLRLAQLRVHHEPSYDHLVGTASASKALGDHLNLCVEQMGVLVRASLFHDLGKIDVAGEILSKPEGLDDGEWAVMEGHPIAALRGHKDFVKALPLEAAGALRHHEFARGGYGDERELGEGRRSGGDRRSLVVPGMRDSKARKIVVLTTMIDTALAMRKPRSYRKEPLDREVIASELGAIIQRVADSGLGEPRELEEYDRAMTYLLDNLEILI